jgi:hypothetical protein
MQLARHGVAIQPAVLLVGHALLNLEPDARLKGPSFLHFPSNHSLHHVQAVTIWMKLKYISAVVSGF